MYSAFVRDKLKRFANKEQKIHATHQVRTIRESVCWNNILKKKM